MSFAACVETPSIECGDLICPESATCVAGNRCVDSSQVDACAGLTEGDSCSFGGGDGTCIGGVCEQTSCGNGVLDEGEVCDDGNVFGGDSCASDCQIASCLVPITHSTVQAIADDAACPIAYLSPGTYAESISVARNIEMLPVGAGAVVLSGVAGSPAVNIEPSVTVRLEDFEISAGDVEGCGGGVRNQGDLFLEDMIIRDNRARSGAGICHLSGSLVIFGGEISGNRADSPGAAFGGGLYAAAVVLVSGGARFTDNVAVSSSDTARGGGFFVELTSATFTGGCEVKGNSAEADNMSSAAFGGAGYANTASLSVIGCELADNEASSQVRANGGALFVSRGNLSVGGGASFVRNAARAADAGGGALAFTAATGTVADASFTDNVVVGTDRGAGGAIRALDLVGPSLISMDKLTISSNSVQSVAGEAYGGGIDIDGQQSSILLEHLTLSANAVDGATAGGGGISYNGTQSDATVLLRRSTVSGNTSTGSGGAVYVFFSGGAVVFDLINSTLSGNSSQTFGGINVVSADPDGGTRIGLFNTTVVQNTSVNTTNGGSGFHAASIGAMRALNVSVNNSLLAGNSGRQCSTIVGVSFLGAGFNVFGGPTPSCDFGAMPGNQIIAFGSLGLGGLADNGGETETHLPGAGSPLINAARPLGCRYFGIDLDADQRDLPRPTACDVGAVEVQ